MKAAHLLFTGVLAIASPWLAAERTLSTQTPVRFGHILGVKYSDCTFDRGGSGLTGTACLESSGIPGEIRVTGIANQTYTVTLFPPAAPSNQISYQPRLENGSTRATVIADAQGHFTLEVGGTLSIGGTAPASGMPTTFIYTVRIDSN